MENFKHPLITAAIFVIALLLLLCGRSIYTNETIKNPLNQLYEQNSAIQNYQIANWSKPLTIEVSLAPDICLKSVWQKIISDTQGIVKDKDFVISITEKQPAYNSGSGYGSEKLTDFLTYTQFLLYEAAANNNYGEIYQKVSALAAENSIIVSLDIDDSNIYLTAKQQNNYYYRIIPRQQGGNEID